MFDTTEGSAYGELVGASQRGEFSGHLGVTVRRAESEPQGLDGEPVGQIARVRPVLPAEGQALGPLADGSGDAGHRPIAPQRPGRRGTGDAADR